MFCLLDNVKKNKDKRHFKHRAFEQPSSSRVGIICEEWMFSYHGFPCVRIFDSRVCLPSFFVVAAQPRMGENWNLILRRHFYGAQLRMWNNSGYTVCQRLMCLKTFYVHWHTILCDLDVGRHFRKNVTRCRYEVYLSTTCHLLGGQA